MRAPFKDTLENLEAGSVVRAFRETLGLSQAQFANYIRINVPGVGGFDQDSISEWENGKTTVPAALYKRARRQLGEQRVAEIEASVRPIEHIKSFVRYEMQAA